MILPKVFIMEFHNLCLEEGVFFLEFMRYYLEAYLGLEEPILEEKKDIEEQHFACKSDVAIHFNVA